MIVRYMEMMSPTEFCQSKNNFWRESILYRSIRLVGTHIPVKLTQNMLEMNHKQQAATPQTQVTLLQDSPGASHHHHNLTSVASVSFVAHPQNELRSWFMWSQAPEIPLERGCWVQHQPEEMMSCSKEWLHIMISSRIISIIVHAMVITFHDEMLMLLKEGVPPYRSQKTWHLMSLCNLSWVHISLKP